MKKMILSTAFILTSIGAGAQNNPAPMASDVRIKQVAYRENDVVPIRGMPFTTTQIQFAEKEAVLDIEGGDTAAWMVTYHKEIPALANIVFVKPTLLGTSSNMTIITNKHAYYFHLVNNNKLNTNPREQTYALKFTYPATQNAQTRVRPTYVRQITPAAPKVVNTAYRFSGSPQLVPLHVFDDGKFTYFELSANGIVPAIFAVDDKSGKESTVNTRREGKYIVVQRLAPQFTLRQGRIATSVFNTKEISRIAANRRPG